MEDMHEVKWKTCNVHDLSQSILLVTPCIHPRTCSASRCAVLTEANHARFVSRSTGMQDARYKDRACWSRYLRCVGVGDNKHHTHTASANFTWALTMSILPRASSRRAIEPSACVRPLGGDAVDGATAAKGEPPGEDPAICSAAANMPAEDTTWEDCGGGTGAT